MGSIYWRSKLAHVCSFGARHYVRVPSKLLNWRSHSILGAALETACLFISRLLLFSLAPCRPDAVRAIAQLHAVVLANSPRVKRRAVLVLVPARHANEGYQLAVTERLAGGVPYPAFEAPSRPFWAIPSTTISTTPSPRPSTTTQALEATLEVGSTSIRIIDTPGFLWKQDESSKNESIRARDILLRSKGRIDRLKDPIPVGSCSYCLSTR